MVIKGDSGQKKWLHWATQIPFCRNQDMNAINTLPAPGCTQSFCFGSEPLNCILTCQSCSSNGQVFSRRWLTLIYVYVAAFKAFCKCGVLLQRFNFLWTRHQPDQHCKYPSPLFSLLFYHPLPLWIFKILLLSLGSGQDSQGPKPRASILSFNCASFCHHVAASQSGQSQGYL